MAQTRRSPARAATAAKDRKMLLRAAQLEKCRMSLWEFQKQRDPKFFRDSRPHLKRISDVLQGVFERKLLKPDGTPYRKVVLSIPPRHGKSYSIAGFGQWAYGKRHDTRIGVVSYNDILTGRFSQGVRDQIAEEKATPEQIVYSDIFPEVKLRYGDSARGIWALEGEYFSFLATSFGGTMTGIGFNIGIIDDPIKLPEEAHNDAILDNQFAWYTDAFLSRLEEDAMVVIVMTRWATRDLAGRVMDEEPGEWLYIRMQTPIGNVFTNVHLAGVSTGGVRFGGYSTAGEGTPKFECDYPAYLYGGIAQIGNGSGSLLELMGVQTGSSAAQSVTNSKTATVDVSFGKAYAEPPLVIANIVSESDSYYLGRCNVAIQSVSTTGFTARLANGGSAAVVFGFNWAAFGTLA